MKKIISHFLDLTIFCLPIFAIGVSFCYQTLNLLLCLLLDLSGRILVSVQMKIDFYQLIWIELPQKNVELVKVHPARSQVLQLLVTPQLYFTGLLVEEEHLSDGILLLLPHVSVDLDHGEVFTRQLLLVVEVGILNSAGNFCHKPRNRNRIAQYNNCFFVTCRVLSFQSAQEYF